MAKLSHYNIPLSHEYVSLSFPKAGEAKKLLPNFLIPLPIPPFPYHPRPFRLLGKFLIHP
jgi:hypothetical protein